MAAPHSRDAIPAGLDFLRTLPAGAVFRFDKIPIPANFFGNGSEAFAETVRFQGRALPRGHFNGQDITHVDTVMRRREPTRLPPPYPRSSAAIPVELTGLALASAEPITVRFRRHTELWNVRVDLSQAKRSTGTMTITKTDPEGGYFDSEFTVWPVFRFTRVYDGMEKLLDVGKLPLPPEIVQKITLRSQRSPWLHSAPGTLILEGLNYNFVAGAPGAINEDSDACEHPVEEAPSCEVVILAQSRCLCLGRERSFTAKVSPGGGTYGWTITSGSGKAKIVGPDNQRHVTVRGTSKKRGRERHTTTGELPTHGSFLFGVDRVDHD